MLNPQTKERELVYVVKVDSIEPIEGKDRVECARVGGWTCMVPKGQFHAGDLGVYFEIDSRTPAAAPFEFLEKRNYKIKTQKFKAGEGHFYSQGLLMAFEDFGWESDKYEEGTFLTKELGVVYAEDADNKRKASTGDKYKKMAQRHPELFKKRPIRWLMRRTWGKKFLFLFLGKKRDKKNAWPAWVVKTDEERIQNLTHMIPSFREEKWYATEKVDGTSTTFTMKGWGRKREFYVCSRNVVFDKPDKKCFYETNVYTEMAEKYDMEYVLECLMEYFSNTTGDDIAFVTVQGETYGAGVQKRDYSIKDHDLAVFNVIYGLSNGTTKRLNPFEMQKLMNNFAVPTVPIIGEVEIPETCAEILEMAAGASALDGLPREGIVFRTTDGAKSFKAVDNGFLMKYHG